FKGGIKPGAMPWKNRYIGNPALSGILRLFFRTSIGDSHCGLRALTRQTLDRLRLSSTGMEFASEMVLKSALLRLRIDEVPATLSPDGRGRPPHLNPWRDGLRHMFYMLILSPTWLFLLPALVLGTFGIAVLSALVIHGEENMVQIGAFGIGDHWAVVAAAAIIVSAQMAFFGCAAWLKGYQDGFRIPTPFVQRLLELSRLQYWMAAGMALLLVGLAWAASITGGWIRSNAGPLDEVRALLAAATFIILGSQVFFGGFLLSIISGNRSRHAIGS
ncbi:MAG: glycosyltransferase family 2 protein, partial [Pseudomonadota bacterium]